MYSLLKYTIIKEIIYILVTITFRILQDDKLLLKVSDFILVKKKLVVVVINSLVCYLFSIVYL